MASRLGYTIGTLALVPLLYAGCKGDSPKSAETPKPAVSQTLEQTAKKAPEGRISDDDLLNLYTQFVPKARVYQKELEGAVIGFSERSKIRPDDVTQDDYDLIRIQLEKKRTADDLLRAVDGLKLEDKTRLSDLLSKSLDINKVRREKGDFYAKGQRRYEVFMDPELTIVAKESYTDTVFVSNPRIYTIEEKIEAIELGNGYWAKFSDFGPKPGHYVREILGKELEALKDVHVKLGNFLKKAKPTNTAEDLEKLLEKEPKDVNSAVLTALGYMGEGSSDFTYTRLKPRVGEARVFTFEDLRQAENDVKQSIAGLSKVLTLK
ncbi:hypothetical protein HYX04_03115 [Candidatus Woesearchaeota archaeon]|nr:hypothetical protein [Candidatus Woesearchaeota archaeon]